MAWNMLFSSDMGLFSLFAIAFTLGMAVWFSRFFARKIREDEANAKKTR